MKKLHKNEIEFLRESNAIEDIRDENSLKQACNAWRYLMQQDVLSVGVILKTHKILMLNQRGLLPNEKGYFRQVPVYVGGHSCMSWENIPKAVEGFIDRTIFKVVGDEKLVADCIKYDHIHYEKIHPFVDGNGRTGRMFLNWQRIKAGLPILIIREGEEQKKYYEWFK